MARLINSILLVEDNEDDVFLMKRALKAARIQNPVFLVEDGEQAVNYLSGAPPYDDREQYLYPDLLFLDLKLPRKSGFEVLLWLRNQPLQPQPEVFVLSSSNMPSDMQQASELNATGYLVKPPTAALLLDLAATHRFEWLHEATTGQY